MRTIEFRGKSTNNGKWAVYSKGRQLTNVRF